MVCSVVREVFVCDEDVFDLVACFGVHFDIVGWTVDVSAAWGDEEVFDVDVDFAGVVEVFHGLVVEISAYCSDGEGCCVVGGETVVEELRCAEFIAACFEVGLVDYSVRKDEIAEFLRNTCECRSCITIVGTTG